MSWYLYDCNTKNQKVIDDISTLNTFCKLNTKQAEQQDVTDIQNKPYVVCFGLFISLYIYF